MSDLKPKISEEKPDMTMVRNDVLSAKFSWFMQTLDAPVVVAFCVLLPELTSLANYFTKEKTSQDTSKV